MMADEALKLPCVMFLASADVPGEDLIKMLMNVKELPPKQKLADGIFAYQWELDNKYYSVKINLCTVGKGSNITQMLYHLCQGVILHFDSANKELIETFDKWNACIQTLAPRIKILLCKNIPDEPGFEKRKLIMEWAKKNEFELVELEPNFDEDEAFENEPLGLEYVIQIFNAHTWPNAVMHKSNLRRRQTRRRNQPDLDEMFLSEESLEQFLDDDDFSSLFAKFFQLKEKVESLQGDERKAAAEVVVKAFWNALGEDVNEL